MKELELRPGTEEVRSNEARPRGRYLGSTTLHAGQKLWVYDPVSGEVKEVDVQKEGVYDMSRMKGVSVRRVMIDASKRYVVALNEKNARRKLGL